VHKRSYQIAIASALLILNGFVVIDSFAQSVAIGGGSSAAKPIAIKREEVENHRVGQALIRVGLDRRDSALVSMVGVSVVVIVNPEGEVTSAHVVPSSATGPIRLSEAGQRKLEAVAGQLRYQPFDLYGHPAWATFLEPRVTVFPPELKPAEHTDFPEVRDRSSVVIRLVRGGCLGVCSSYTVEVHGDGMVLYDGGSFVAVTGKHRCSISQEKVRELVKMFRDADYFSLQDKYAWDATDLPAYVTSIEIDGESKTIMDYAGPLVGMPLAVSDLERAIDRVSGSAKWVAGGGDLVDCLRKEGWDFHSRESAEMLASVAQYGTVRAVLDLVRAGVSLDGGRADAPLVWATRKGDLEGMRLLRDAGVGPNDNDQMAAALSNAIYHRQTRALNELRDWMVDAHADEGGESKFMLASQSGVISVVRLLLKDKPDVNARDKKGRTALMLAVQQDHDERSVLEIDRAAVAEALLESGADVNLRDERGNTALIYAGWDENVTRKLLMAGANIDAQNNLGNTALMACVSPDVAWLLLANHADASIKNAEGKTALDMARDSKMGEKENVLVTGKRAK